MPNRFNTTAYRYPSEYGILAGTVILVLLVIGLTAAATLCGSVLFMAFILFLSYNASTAQHNQLLRHAKQITLQDRSGLAEAITECARRLQVEPVQVFIVPSRTFNAYTFGLSSPKAIVLYEPLLQVMDREELQFVIGHEMGHVRLGHTWLNSLVGGMAGIPTTASAALLLVLALRSWNRACEYSADRAGLLACGAPDKAVTALIKLEAGADAGIDGLDTDDIRRAIQRIETQDDDWVNNLGELVATHPMIIKRIQELRQYTRSGEYRTLQSQVNQNLLI